MDNFSSVDYDSEFCGSIPLHLINQIQEYGFLLVVSKETLKILQVSENIPDFLQINVRDALSKNLSDIVPATDLLEIKEGISQLQEGSSYCFVCNLNYSDQKTAFDCILHLEKQNILIEFEPHINTGTGNIGVLYRDAYSFVKSIKEGDSIGEMVSESVDEIRRQTGFDRVMFYRFDKKWNGNVIAESKEEDMDSLLHLWFPASDVPRQAREMYLHNPYRMIPDRNFAPRKILPIVNPATHSFTDISVCNLRSVANVHIEYLKNMKVGSSLSVPLINNKQLWGLIACHHRTPKCLSLAKRTYLQTMAGIISSRISSKEKEVGLTEKVELNSILLGLIENVYTKENLPEALFEETDNVLHLLGLGGAAISYDGEILFKGNTPSKVEVKYMINWLQRNNIDDVFCDESFPDSYPEASDYKEIVAGLIALPISTREGSYILGFRPELVTEIAWGGNPKEAVQMEKDGNSYHPRKSFEIWKETVVNKSLPWSGEEKYVAERLKNAILRKNNNQ